MNQLSTPLPFALRLAVIAILAVSTCMVSATRAQSDSNWALRDADHFELHLPEIRNLEEWELRKVEIRENLLVSSGLWPLPEKTPLNARIFDERSGNGFTVSKVYFESLPGFFATGNLYMPASGSGPFPAVLSPHGHWQYGRLQNGESGSIPGRCIDFARQGFVILSLDMVGYNDSFQLPHDPNKSRAQLKADSPLPYEPNLFRADFDFPRARLYGFSLAGLQLWNGIRALDFLCSLKKVDPDRIGVTGASGGATQTILLMTADQRVKVAAPVNIIGAEKHPGCRCENSPGLWIGTSTVEMSAAFSPRPLLLMSASEDPWTHSTPQREYPLIARYYALHGAKDNLANVHITGGHNYNAETRAAVYKWFCRHLNPNAQPISDPVPVSNELEALGDLRVFPDKILPRNASSGWQVIKNWIDASEKSYRDFLPASGNEYPSFAQQFRKALGRVMSADRTLKEIAYRYRNQETRGDISYQLVEISHLNGEGWLELESIQRNDSAKGNALLVYPREMGELNQIGSRSLEQVIDVLLEKDFRVYHVRGFASGHERIPKKLWETYSWPDAYNKNNQLRAVQDILLSLDFIAQTHTEEQLIVAGLGPCGVETAFASALFDRAGRVIIDLNGHDPGYDGELSELMPLGALKRVGDFRTALLLLMDSQVTILNAGPTFDREWYLAQARRLGFERNLKFESGKPEVF